MKNVGRFYKVSLEQFLKDLKARSADRFEYKYDDLVKSAEEVLEDLAMPRRKTVGSAGYDFFSPFKFNLLPGESIIIPTGYKVQIKDEWWLAIYPKSGLSFEYRLKLDDTIPVIDGDYFNNKNNEGHILIKITNNSHHSGNARIVNFDAGDAYCQAIFSEYGLTDNDDTTETREGGFGSTGRKSYTKFWTT